MEAASRRKAARDGQQPAKVMEVVVNKPRTWPQCKKKSKNRPLEFTAMNFEKEFGWTKRKSSTVQGEGI